MCVIPPQALSLQPPPTPDLCAWIDQAHEAMRHAAPDVASLLDDYAGEARFGAACVGDDLRRLAPGAEVLEVGAGAGLLSAALASRGFRVTALEPLGSGFSHMRRLQTLVDDYTTTLGIAVNRVHDGAEQLPATGAYAFAFSINVMEHVPDVAAVLRGVWGALAPGAAYRFVCPNYALPYEPHFGIPTLGSKTRTWQVFRRRILSSQTVVDPRGTWDSLNWISVPEVRRICRREFGVAPAFDRRLLGRFLARAATDPSFQRRHGAVMRLAGRLCAAPVMQRAAGLVPPALQPAMSCAITRGR